jgi:hypothetical protein
VTVQRDSGIFVPTGTPEELERSLARVTIRRDSGIFVPTGTPEELEQSLARAAAQLRPGITVSSEILKDMVEQALSHLAEDNPHAISNAARDLTEYLKTFTKSDSARRQNRLTGMQMAQLTGVFLLVSVGTMLQVSVPKEFDALTKVTGFVADAVAIGAAISIIRIAVRRNRQD